MSPRISLLCVALLPLLSFGCGSETKSSTPTGSSAVPAPCPTAPSGSITLNSGETLRITFTLSPTANTDVLITDFGFQQASGSYTYRLLNGSTLLGTVQGGPTPFWKSAGSQFSSGTAVDLSSIVNGTIDGRAEFVVNSGSSQLDLSRATIVVARSNSSNGFSTVATGSKAFTLISTACR